MSDNNDIEVGEMTGAKDTSPKTTQKKSTEKSSAEKKRAVKKNTDKKASVKKEEVNETAETEKASEKKSGSGEESVGHALIRKMIFSVSLGVFCYALSGLLVIMWGYYSSQREYDRLNKDQSLVVIGKPDTTANDAKPGDSNTTVDIDETGKRAPYIDIKIDEEKWKAINKDYAFYMYIPGTKIQYPVVQGEDNNHYLRYTYENKENTAGAVSIDSRTKKDPYFEDFNMIISAHNRQDGTMFSDLAKYKDESFRDENPYVYIVYNGKEYVFEFFAFYTMKPVAICYNPKASSEPYLDFINENNNYKNSIDVTTDDTIITLYTCNEDSSMRYVSHAKLIQVMNLR